MIFYFTKSYSVCLVINNKHMLKIKKIRKNEYESDTYINDKLFPSILSYEQSNSFFCQSFSDFNLLNEYQFKQLIENEVESIDCNNTNTKENRNCYFSYSVNTTFRDPDYTNYLKESEFKNLDELFPEYIDKGTYVKASIVFKYGE